MDLYFSGAIARAGESINVRIRNMNRQVKIDIVIRRVVSAVRTGRTRGSSARDPL